ncbi:MAG TPA: acetate/propionate family kinase [Thermoanaerobaculia bacterium]
MKILALNPGSSSMKRRAFEFPAAAEIDDPPRPDAIGVRVVHGGSRFTAPVRVDDAVLAGIEELAELAPLHNPRSAATIEEARRSFPEVPIVAVFDTAFHQTLPPAAAEYAVPRELGIRRFGFHGVSYSYLASQVRARRHVACHLGNGASVCAILDGRSVDTSMGFTPMEGLVMGTRAGDLDPGAILHLLRKGMGPEDLDALLNERCGLLGVSGRSGDMRELERAAAGGDERAALAIEMFTRRVAKYAGAYAAVLGGLDALTFTGGIGEHSWSVRADVCRSLAFLGVVLDEERNRAPAAGDRCISRGAVEVRVIPANEELEIARLTFRELS